MLDRLHLLPSYIRTLGLITGFRYWRISNKCAKHPELTLQWAAKCQADASTALAHGDEKEAHALLSWAEEFRASHAAYTGTKRKPGLKQAPVTVNLHHRNGAVTIRKVGHVAVAKVRTKRAGGHPSASRIGQKSRNGAK